MSKYRILGLVGQGQFGRVFCAVHRQTGQLVALKSLDHQRFPTHKFLRELRFLLSLKHPNIVNCRALEHTATGRYLVMDYCEGGTLRSLMTDSHCLTLAQSIGLVVDVLQGIEHAHSRGIVHCDIKPENILLNVQPQGWMARISDFGIARLNQELEGQGLGNTGSPAYMAPERFYGQYPLSSDLYAVGILLFELMAGHRPFSGSPGDLMSAHLNRPVQMPDSVPEVWRPIILTALQKLSARRFHSAREMLAAIQAVAAQEGVGVGKSAQVHLPLLESDAVINAFDFQHQEPLGRPVTALAPLQDGDCTPKVGLLFEAWHRFFPKSAIQSLAARPQGCFVMTRRSVHLLSTQGALTTKLSAHLLLELNHDGVMAIAPQGGWFVTLENTRSGKLCFWKVKAGESQGKFCQYAVLTARSTIALQSLPILPPLLFALDNRHAAVISTPLERQHPRTEQSGSLVQVMTRRGSEAGLLQLPVRLGQAIATLTPYQLLATDADNPDSILLIDLKPHRVLRLGVGIVPKFLSVTPWGMILADAQGSLLLMSQAGEVVGRIQGPDRITAIAPCNAHTLQVATWNDNQGYLYTVDLRELDIDLLF